MIDIAAIGREVYQLHQINVSPKSVLMHPRDYCALVMAMAPQEAWANVTGLSIYGVPVLGTEEDLGGRPWVVSLMVPLGGTVADARRGAE